MNLWTTYHTSIRNEGFHHTLKITVDEAKSRLKVEPPAKTEASNHVGDYRPVKVITEFRLFFFALVGLLCL